MKTTQIPIGERKLLWKWLFALAAFEQAEQCIALVVNQRLTEKDKPYSALTAAMIMHYARPFTESKGAGRLPAESVPENRRALHRAVMTMRHRMVAHSDAKAVFNDNGYPINAAIFRVDAKGSRFQNTGYPFKARKLFEFQQLIHDVSNAGKDYTAQFRARYGDEFPTEEGSYLLNIKGTGGSLWKPFVPLKLAP